MSGFDARRQKPDGGHVLAAQDGVDGRCVRRVFHHNGTDRLLSPHGHVLPEQLQDPAGEPGQSRTKTE